jgi:hypothetical protein
MATDRHVPAASRLIAAGLFASLVVGGCATAPRSPAPTAVSTTAASASPRAIATATSIASSSPAPSPTAVPDRNPAAIVEGVPYAVTIDPVDFSSTVSNPYFPLVPGTSWTFDGGGEHVVVTVTDRTREIAGVTTVVVHDQAFEDGAVVEDTEDYYATDISGNVWYFGEVTGECDGTKITSREGSWEAGVDGALPGVVMLARNTWRARQKTGRRSWSSTRW